MSSFFSTLKQGQIYLQTWPLEAKLGMIFPENRIIKATKFAQKFMPFMAVFAVVWQQLYAKADLTAFSLAILTALCAVIYLLQNVGFERHSRNWIKHFGRKSSQLLQI